MNPARKKLAKNTVRVALMLAFTAGTACQVIAGVEDRAIDPIPEGCTLPTVGDATIRFGNLVPSEEPVDVCVRQSGGDYGRPVLRGGGRACPTGFGYPKMSAPFAVPSGKIDVKVVKGGSTCKTAALAETTGIEIPKGSATTVVRMGNAAVGEQVKAFRETTERASSGNQLIRLAHAIPGYESLDFGITEQSRLPTDLSSPLLSAPLPYGTTTIGSSSPLGKVDENGYLTIPGASLNFAAAPAGQKRAVLLASLAGTEGGRTIWAIGDPAKPFLPIRALTCSEGDVVGLETACVQSQLSTLSFDIFNAQLYGPFALHEAERRPHIVEAIGKRASDAMCITGLSRQSDKDALIQQGKDKGNYPYAVDFKATPDTKATDPRDQSGNTPPDWTTPPCDESVRDKAEAALSCIVANCSSTKTEDGIFVGDSSCLTTNCAAQIIPFLSDDKQTARCMNCLAISPLTDEPLSSVRTHCMEEPREYKHFNGGTSSIVLSRFPIAKQETYVLPSTSYQRVVHYAQLEIEQDKYLDYYCAELTAAFGSLLAYPGHYAPDATIDKWFQEERHQATRIVEWIKTHSGSNPAVISGEWASSREHKDGEGNLVVDGQNPEVFDILEGAFTLALPPDYVPRCTECKSPVNPYNGDKNIWQLKTYVYNMSETSGVEASVLWTDFPVTIGDQKYPLSDRFLFNTQVLRP